MKTKVLYKALLPLLFLLLAVLLFKKFFGYPLTLNVSLYSERGEKAVPSIDDTVLQPAASPGKASQVRSVEELKEVAKALYYDMSKAPFKYHCKNVVRTDKADGWYYCNDTGFVPQKNSCLIFSFGINYNYRFDNYWAKAGCEVHSFDPSQAREGEHDPRVKFYFIGIGGEDTDTFVPRLNYVVKKKTEWKVRTMKTLLRELNHSNTIIDILKMDVEVAEWPVIRNMLDTNVLSRVKQLLVEWHVFRNAPPRETFPELLQTFKDLEAMGFRRFYRHKQGDLFLDWERLNFQSDSGYINSNFLP